MLRSHQTRSLQRWFIRIYLIVEDRHLPISNSKHGVSLPKHYESSSLKVQKTFGSTNWSKAVAHLPPHHSVEMSSIDYDPRDFCKINKADYNIINYWVVGEPPGNRLLTTS